MPALWDYTFAPLPSPPDRSFLVPGTNLLYVFLQIVKGRGAQRQVFQVFQVFQVLTTNVNVLSNHLTSYLREEGGILFLFERRKGSSL